MIKTASLALACVALLAVTTQQAQALPISPTFDTFGSLPAATFGGTGIPNDAVAISTFVVGINGSSNTITLGLAATRRFGPPSVGNDGAGTFTAVAGGFPGVTMHAPADPTLARWNFSYFIEIVGPGVLTDYAISLLYDFDPGAGTDDADHGVIDVSAALLAFDPSATLVEDSQNLGFGFLAAASPFITPPAFPGFDPNAIGEYTFALRVSDLGGGLLGESAIQVNTVPEPISASLFGIGALGLAIGGVRRRRRTRSA